MLLGLSESASGGRSSHPHSLLLGCESKALFPSGSSFSLLDSSLPEDTPVVAAEAAVPAPSAVLTRYLESPEILEEGGGLGF